uniref:HSF-type DNA-binding domain-containing protein n=1 Tax=Heterosigma akashiwo TaxID=2829 RepID=A0A6V1UTD2_HETAK
MRNTHSSEIDNMDLGYQMMNSPAIVKLESGFQPPDLRQACRALPRRRKEGNEEPIFVRKTFEMVNACDRMIVCWTEDGKSFLVKDRIRLAREVIPRYFKHNKFSSFVRQLNFYGFRKVKSAALLSEAIPSEWLEFHHPKFQRGMPHILCEIKRASHFEEKTSNVAETLRREQEEVSQLRSEVCDLRYQLANVTSELSQMKSLISQLMNEKRMGEDESSTPAKRKKFAGLAQPSKATVKPVSKAEFNFSAPRQSAPPVGSASVVKVEGISERDPLERLPSLVSLQSDVSFCNDRMNSDFDLDSELISDLLEMDIVEPSLPSAAPAPPTSVSAGAEAEVENYTSTHKPVISKLEKRTSVPLFGSDMLPSAPDVTQKRPSLASVMPPSPLPLNKKLISSARSNSSPSENSQQQAAEIAKKFVESYDFGGIVQTLVAGGKQLQKKDGTKLAPIALPLASATLAAFFNKLAAQGLELKDLPNNPKPAISLPGAHNLAAVEVS